MLIKYEPPPLTVRPESYGAIGDGVNDDSPAIQDAIDAGGENSLIQFTPDRTYKLNSGLSFPYNYQVIHAYGVQFTVNFLGVGITLGRPDDELPTTRFIQWRGGRVIRNTNDFTAGNIGLRCLNLSHSSAFDFKIFGFEKGLELLGDGTGTQYNTFIPAEIGYCKYGVALIARNSGWANANVVMGGARIGFYENQPDSTGGYSLYLNREATSANIINQNQFYGLSLENGTVTLGQPAGAIYANCQDCLFHGLRYEGFLSPKVNGNTTDFENNHFDAGNSLLDPNADISLPGNLDPRTVFFQGYRGALWCGGGGIGGDALLTLKNRGSATDKVLVVKQSENTERIVLRADGGISQTTATGIGRYSGAKFGGRTNWNPGTIAAGATATTTVTISGAGGTGGSAISSNPCIAALSTWKPGLSLSAHIDPAQTAGFNTAVVLLKNETASPIVVADGGTITVHVHQMDMT